MTGPVLFYFDYVSPYAYLANTRLQELGLEVAYRPIASLQVMEMVHNQPSPKCPAKLRYAMTDTARWASRYAVPLEINAKWWKAVSDGSLSMRLFTSGALAAEELGYLDAYHARIFDAIWGHSRDVVTPGGRERLLDDAGLPGRAIWTRAAEPGISSELDRRSREAADAGVFGVPTFAVGRELFFGNDRLEFVTERVAA